MMIYNELKTIFRIYDNIAKQNRFLKPGSIDQIFMHLTPKDGPLPWQFRVPVPLSGTNEVTSWRIINAQTEAESYDLDSLIGDIGTQQTVDGYDYFFHAGGTLEVDSETFAMDAGYYYLQFDVNGAVYVSDVFQVGCMLWSDPEFRYLYLEIDNDGCDLAPIMYQTGWKQKVLLDSHIEKETPSIEEEGVEDGAKNFVPTLQKFMDNLRFELLVPYSVGEGLVLMCMHKRVVLTTPGGIYSGVIKNMRPALAQQVIGNIYLFTIEFQQDTVYLNTSCCANIELV